MGFPNKPDKHGEPGVFSAAEMLERQRKVARAMYDIPEGVILSYQPQLLRYASKALGGKRQDGFPGDLYMPKKSGKRVAVVGNFGVGAPVTAVVLENMVACGARRFISIGIAGGLQTHLDQGDLIVADRAIRDEGTSHHYMPGTKFALASETLTVRLCQALDEAGRTYHLGPSWTIDAPYRETQAEVIQYQKEGVLTVEMESAALFAVAQYLGVDAAAAFAIDDSLADGRWKASRDARQSEIGLRILFDAAVVAVGS